MNNNKIFRYISIGSLIALVSAFALGIILRNSDMIRVESGIYFCHLFGRLWILGVLVISIPLINGFLVFSILNVLNSGNLGKLGAYSFFIHLLLLTGGTIFGLIYTLIVLEIFGPQIPVITNLESIEPGRITGPLSGNNWREWIMSVSSAVQKILGTIILYSVAISVVFALIVQNKFKRKIAPIIDWARKLGDRSMTVLSLFLTTMPVAVFCFILPMAYETGFISIESMIYFVVFICILLLVGSILLLLAIRIYANIPMAKLLSASLPSQIFAISSRSSLATMPSLIDCTVNRLDIPHSTAITIIPLYLSLFKMNMAVNGLFQLIFLAHIFGVDMSISTVLIFTVAHFLISLGSPGIPSGSKYVVMPLYVSAGIPVQGFILMKAVDVIPDMLKTLINVLEVLTITCLVHTQQSKLEPENTITQIEVK